MNNIHGIVGHRDLRDHFCVGHHVHRIGRAPVPALRKPAALYCLGIRERSERAKGVWIRLEQTPVEEVFVVRVERRLHRVVAVGRAHAGRIIRLARRVPDVQLVAIGQVVSVRVKLADGERKVVRRVAELLEVEFLRHVLEERRERNGVHALDGDRVALGIDSRCAGLRRRRVVAVEVVHRRVHHDDVRREGVHIAVRDIDDVCRRTNKELTIHLEHSVHRVARLRVTGFEARVHDKPVRDGSGGVRRHHDVQEINIVSHHIIRTGEIRVVEERVSAVGDFPAVREAVAVGVGVPRVGAVVVLFRILEAVAVGVGVVLGLVGLDVDGRNPLCHVLDAVGLPVLVDVRVLHHDDRGRDARPRGRDLERDWRVEILRVSRDLAGIAPCLVSVTHSVRVGVDERHHVVAAGRDAVEHCVRGNDVERLREVVGERRDLVVAGKADARDGLGREVRRLVHANHDVGENRLGRTEVPHVGREAPVAGVGIASVHACRELRRLAPHVRRELSVQLCDAPEVVGGVGERLAHVGVRPERAAIHADDGHEVGRRIHDVAKSFIGRDLERERVVSSGRLPGQRRTRRGDGVAVVCARAARGGRDEGRGELPRERVDRLGRAVVEIDGVCRGADCLGLKASETLGIGEELCPVEVPFAVGEEICLGEGLSVAEVERLGINCTRLDGIAVDRGAHDADARHFVALRRNVEHDGGGAERDLEGCAVEANVHVADKASPAVSRNDERICTLLEAIADKRRLKESVRHLAGHREHGVGLAEILVGVSNDRHVGRAIGHTADTNTDVRQRLAAIALGLFDFVPDNLAGNVIKNNWAQHVKFLAIRTIIAS